MGYQEISRNIWECQDVNGTVLWQFPWPPGIDTVQLYGQSYLCLYASPSHVLFDYFSVKGSFGWELIYSNPRGMHFRKNTHNMGRDYDILALSLTRYVDDTPTSEATPVTTLYIHPLHHGYPNVTVMIDSHLFHSMSISPTIPETSGSRSWVWSKDKVIQSAQDFLDLFSFVSHQSNKNAWDTAILKFDLDKIQGQGHGCCQRSRPHSSTSIKQMSIRPTIPEICPIECLTLTETHSKF